MLSLAADNGTNDVQDDGACEKEFVSEIGKKKLVKEFVNSVCKHDVLLS